MVPTLQIGETIEIVAFSEECLEPHGGHFASYSIALSEANDCCRPFISSEIGLTEMVMTEERKLNELTKRNKQKFPINLQQKNAARNLMLKNDIDFSL